MPDHGAVSAVNRDEDLRHLSEALGLAARIPVRPWPNPPVGAVVVRAGETVGRGAHHGAGSAHAERVALGEAGEAARGATLYCTLEPCNHHGRTPPCTEAILAAGVSRVVYGVDDPNPQATGGAERLRQAGLEVTGGVHAAACLDLIWPFVCTDQFARPYVELKTATSLDGRFGGAHDPQGQPTYLTGPAARRDVHVRRRWVDLVLVGSGTARHDRPRLDVRLADQLDDGPAAAPLAGVMAQAGAADAPLSCDRWLVFHAAGRSGALAAGAEGVPCTIGPDGHLDVHDLLGACQARGLHTVMVEGGPRVAASFLAAGVVDRWVQYLAPRVVGDGPSWPAWNQPATAGLHLTAATPVGDDLRVIWDRRDHHGERRRLAPGEVG